MKPKSLSFLTLALVVLASVGMAQHHPKHSREQISKIEKAAKPGVLADVFHTNGNLWVSYNTEGDIGRCNATVPSYTYPGGSIMYYLCRGGIWITAKGEQIQLRNANNQPVSYLAAESGFYTNSGLFSGTATYNNWANPGATYNKEPWRTETVYRTEVGIDVRVNRYSWSFPGKNGGRFFAISDTTGRDYNDFVISDYVFTYTGDLNGDGTPEAFAAPQIDQLAIGIKADHDCGWNIGEAGFEENFWEDDITEYDSTEGISYVRDEDNPTTAENDAGIDDPKREYRDIRVGHVVLYVEDALGVSNFQLWDGSQYRIIPATKANMTHYWWTGANDPTTALKRFLFATAVFNANDEVSSDVFTYDPNHRGDLKTSPPATPTDMRYGVGIGPFTIQLGQSVRIISAEVAGSGIANIRRAVRAAKNALDRANRFTEFHAIPAPPPAPQVTSRVLGNATVEITWTDVAEGKIDTLSGTADFAGYIIYRAVQWPPGDSRTLYQLEGLDPNLVKSISKAFAADAGGPYRQLIRYPSTQLPTKTAGRYTYIDTDVIPGFNYWYYVASFDSDSLESARTLCYPFQDPGNGTPIPVNPPRNAVSFAAASNTAFLDAGFIVVPNPWTPEAPPGQESIKFFGLPQRAKIRVYDVSGGLIWEREHNSTDGSEVWDMYSNERVRVVSGIYFARVENLQTSDVKFAKFAIIRK